MVNAAQHAQIGLEKDAQRQETPSLKQTVPVNAVNAMQMYFVV